MSRTRLLVAGWLAALACLSIGFALGRRAPRLDPPSPVLPEEMFICPLCREPEMLVDMVSGVCLDCADSIAFGQNMRRASIAIRPRDN